MSILKVETRSPSFFRFLTRLYLKLKFVSNNFWTKNPKAVIVIAVAYTAVFHYTRVVNTAMNSATQQQSVSVLTVPRQAGAGHRP